MRRGCRYQCSRFSMRYLRMYCLLFVWLFLIGLTAGGCSGKTSKASDGSSAAKEQEKGEPRDATPQVRVPSASGEVVYGVDNITLDASHTADGYVMLNYSGTNEKVKFQIQAPDGTTYTYLVTNYGEYAVYPLPAGSGTYTTFVYEAVSAEENMYAVAFTQELDVTIADEFAPFLYPNYYVNFTAESASVQKGAELAENCYSDLDVVSNIYNYVIENISYDEEKAQTVPSGYTPVPDETLETGTGICFDYASLMSAMLRSQKIPTRLEVGYAGEVYHAWISCYVDEIGWVDNIIEFDGKEWSLMDPTLAANNSSSAVKKYIGDGSRYMIKYTY